MTTRFTRRTLIGWGILSGGLLLGTACSSPAAPTTAPAKTSAPAPTQPAAKPADIAKPAATAAAPAKPAATTAAPAAKAGAVTTIKMGIPVNLFELLYPRAARDAGVYKEFNIDVDFTETTSDNLLRGLLAGEFLVSRLGPQEVMGAVAGGADVRIIAAPHTGLPFYLVAQEGLTSLESLYGKNVGSSGARGFLENLIVALYKTKGADPTKLQFVNTTSTSQSVAPFAQKQIDASLMLYTDMEALRQSGAKWAQIADLRVDLPKYLRQIIAIRGQSLQADDAIIRTFVVAQSKAYRWALTNKAAVVEAAQKYQGRDKAQSEKNFDLLLQPGLVTPEFSFTPDQIDYLQQLNIDQGVQTQKLPFERVADLRYVNAVKEQLGPFTPPKP